MGEFQKENGGLIKAIEDLLLKCRIQEIEIERLKAKLSISKELLNMVYGENNKKISILTLENFLKIIGVL